MKAVLATMALLAGSVAVEAQTPAAAPQSRDDARVTESWSGRFQWTAWTGHPGYFLLYRDGKLWYAHEASTRQWWPWLTTAWGPAEKWPGFPPEKRP